MDKQISIFSRSFDVAKESFRMLSEQPRLVFYPLFCGFLTVFFFLVFLILNLSLVGVGHGIANSTLLFLLFSVIFIVTFSKLGITLALRSSYTDSPLSLGGSFKKVLSKSQLIFGWSLFSSSACMIIMGIANIKNLGFVAGIFGIYWSLATYFIIPSLTEEDITLADTFSSSVEALKRGWREMIILNLGLKFIIFLALFPILVTIGILLMAIPVFFYFSPIYLILITIFILALLFILSVFAIFVMMYHTTFDLYLYMDEQRSRPRH